MSGATISTPKASAVVDVESAGSGDAATTAGATPVPVNVCNPLSEPYRTGSYLIYDQGGMDHFRSAMDATKLGQHTYHASGSHQLNLDAFLRVLGQEVVGPYKPSTLYLVDLREETHGFLDGIAVSWYADNDFANVGQSEDWITADETARLGVIAGQTTQVFTIEDDPGDNRDQQRVMPVSYTDVVVGAAYDEAQVATILTAKFKPIMVEYLRIPVTDHCAPSDRALEKLVKLWNEVSDNDWVHFHCHGGDGRTTTFLALSDMLCWKKSGAPLPSLEDFACRQCQLFAYCLNPDGCNCGECNGQQTTGWKRSLAEVRWDVLDKFLNSEGGGS